MNWNFSEVLEESNGGYSSIRLAFLTWALVILIVWATISIQNRTLVDIDPTVSAILFTLMVGKVYQRTKEDKTPPEVKSE